MRTKKTGMPPALQIRTKNIPVTWTKGMIRAVDPDPGPDLHSFYLLDLDEICIQYVDPDPGGNILREKKWKIQRNYY